MLIQQLSNREAAAAAAAAASGRSIKLAAVQHMAVDGCMPTVIDHACMESTAR
jgi:hypothetical protein